eukprot:TRINITY_DN32645_c0_g1_i1.p1 TRINITY_DN32645_c0_g1~~TRINITY_DN32645_c0_g1_i1.p1  ORF type:complete len:309 (+),score=36.00 TRINITY_DN32645_c0_g1_i1:95-1021(+)
MATVRWRCTPCNGLPIGIRAKPFIDGPRVGSDVEPNEIFKVSEEICQDGVIYLKLADGRGWLFNQKPGIGIMCSREDQAAGSAGTALRRSASQPGRGSSSALRGSGASVLGSAGAALTASPARPNAAARDAVGASPPMPPNGRLAGAAQTGYPPRPPGMKNALGRKPATCPERFGVGAFRPCSPIIEESPSQVQSPAATLQHSREPRGQLRAEPLYEHSPTGETEEDEDDDLPEPTLEDLGIVEEPEDFTHQEQVEARLEAELEAAIADLAKQIAQSKDSGLDAATQARMLKLAPRVKDLQVRSRAVR